MHIFFYLEIYWVNLFYFITFKKCEGGFLASTSTLKIDERKNKEIKRIKICGWVFLWKKKKSFKFGYIQSPEFQALKIHLQLPEVRELCYLLIKFFFLFFWVKLILEWSTQEHKKEKQLNLHIHMLCVCVYMLNINKNKKKK